jgi:hypothetical protein
MIKVKTFGESLLPLKTHMELENLDQRVNEFISENNISRVISISDSTTSSEGSTIGIVRVLVYEV